MHSCATPDPTGGPTVGTLSAQHGRLQHDADRAVPHLLGATLEGRPGMTRLPDAHVYVTPATGRLCAACDRRRKHGVHRYSAAAVRPMVARRSTYRTSGTPYLAMSALWRMKGIA